MSTGVTKARQAMSPARVSVVVCVLGLVITAALSWTAWTLNDRNEHRLLVVQTRQAGAVLASTILSLRDPLATALEVQEATGGDPTAFTQSMSAATGPDRLFASASAWRFDGSSFLLVATLGDQPRLTPGSPAARAFFTRALHSATFVVTSMGSGSVERVGYAIADPADARFVVYAERSIPANRQAPIESNPAFANLDYATYLGPATSLAALATTDVPLSRLPLTGDVARDDIAFGDTSVTLIATPHRQLGGALGRQLPWVLLAGGLLLTAVTAGAGADLVRRRRKAEQDAGTIATLYDRLDVLYGDQRTIAQALQQAMLPASNPTIPELEIASRYVAGAQGVDIGGDWYSLIDLGNRRFAFAVGDVSGRGVSAATVMARLRFTIRAYLLEGHRPETVLEMCSHQLDVSTDAHFATVLVGVGDLDSGEVVVANAGHLNPLVLSSGSCEFVMTKLGPPLGIAPTAYVPTSIRLSPGSTFLAFTDGLVERRGESIDDGLRRLEAAASEPAPDLDTLLGQIVERLTSGESEDDVAMLAFRWLGRAKA